MKLSPQWIRDFVDLTVDDRRLAEDLTAVGIAVEGISRADADAVFEMEIGTNRPDAMNHYGVAREAAAIYDLPLKAVAPKLPPAAKAAASSGDADAALKGRSSTGVEASFPITVEEPSLCPRFSARVIRGTTIKPSPAKIAHRLQLLDQRPISNAVDATNYVLWEIGKPTHVFDMDLLEGGKIIVRKARAGETLKTLDGIERKLTPDDLVVCDAKKPVGLAGVMGGYDTMITEKTRNILIESAWWDPGIVRKMSRRHGLHTDASHRFERGADFESTVLSCDLVAQMILESGGGELVGDVVDVVSKPMDTAPVVLNVSEVRRILGGTLDTGIIFRLLKRLGFTLIPEGQNDARFRVYIPSWRLDVEREIDVIEEIARLHGYDKFENTLPAYSGAVVELPHAAMDAILRRRALALGYNEALSLTFISHADAEKFSSVALEAAAKLRLESPDVFVRRARESMARHVEAMVGFQDGGAEVFDYGNSLRAEAVLGGYERAFEYPGFLPAYIRPLFCEGLGPFRWVALSGDPADIAATDRAVLEEFPDHEHLHRWIQLAGERVAFQGLPARICWLGYGERHRLGLRFNEMVRRGELKAPIVIGRDHLDSGSVASPYRETEAMIDGSDAIADWPLLNALVNTASGASWVSIHHGGGVGIGRSIHAGQVSVADGTDLAAQKLERVLTNDPGMGVIRHADAGYPEALAVAEERGVVVPMVGR